MDEKSSGKIRILAANLPELLLYIIRQAVISQKDMEMLGHVRGQIEVLLAAKSNPDILILGTVKAYPPPGLISQLLSGYPQLKILVLPSSSEGGSAYWLGLKHRAILSVSSAELVNTIRSLYGLNEMEE
ncbi:MAG: hypothetical protein K8I82_24240 [Anaerolineae bacterium]|nr:hypothetical protein [Anaerolineae bacterium]